MSLAAGFTALRRGKWLVIALTAMTAVLALLAAAPLAPALKASFAGTLAGDHVLHNVPGFAATDVIDFLREKAAAVDGASAAARWAALLALLQQILFAGGLVTVLGRAAPISLPKFVLGARRNFWHNLKCFLLFLLAAGLFFGAWFAAAGAARRKLLEGLAPGAWQALSLRIVVAVGALLLFAVLSLLHDFARAARRGDPGIGAWRAYGDARRTLSGRWPRALGLFFFWLLFGGVLLALGIALEWNTPAVSGPAIAFHVLLQIAVLSIRPALRIAAWGSYLSLYDSSRPAPPQPVLLVEPGGEAADSLVHAFE